MYVWCAISLSKKIRVGAGKSAFEVPRCSFDRLGCVRNLPSCHSPQNGVSRHSLQDFAKANHSVQSYGRPLYLLVLNPVTSAKIVHRVPVCKFTSSKIELVDRLSNIQSFAKLLTSRTKTTDNPSLYLSTSASNTVV